MDNLLDENQLVTTEFVKNSDKLGQLCYFHRYLGDQIQVRELDGYRWMIINNVVQSVIRLNHPEALLFNHLRILEAVWTNINAPNKVLELGLGGGAIHNYLACTYPNATVETVERNSEIIACHQRFFTTKYSKQITCNDALIELNRVIQYDWIIIDLFCHEQAPRFLYQSEFYNQIKQTLTHNGYLFINFIAEHESQLVTLHALLGDVFDTQVNIKKAQGYSNHIVWLQKP